MGRGVAVKLTCDAKIAENDVAVGIDKDVLRFNVSVYDVMCVDVLDGEELSNRVERRSTTECKRDVQVLPCKSESLLCRVL